MSVVLITPEAFLDKPAPHVDALCSAGFEVVYPHDPTFMRGFLSEEETIAELSVCDAVIAGGERFTERVLDNLPRLRVIARSGVGYDRVDVRAATARGIVLTITPTANFAAVAEHTLALLFAVAKDTLGFDRRVRDNSWQRALTEPIRGSTIGIVGLGRIGREVARGAKALGMHVVAFETQPDERFVEQHEIELTDFDTLLNQSDYVSIHCPLNTQTRGMFNRQVFDKMKPGSVLLNTARGPLVVEADLIDALQRGQLRAAGLDVLEAEPPRADNPLLNMDNVVLSPHIGGEDRLSSEMMGLEAALCIVDLRDGKWPEGAVINQELRGKWSW